MDNLRNHNEVTLHYNSNELEEMKQRNIALPRMQLDKFVSYGLLLRDNLEKAVTGGVAMYRSVAGGRDVSLSVGHPDFDPNKYEAYRRNARNVMGLCGDQVKSKKAEVKLALWRDDMWEAAISGAHEAFEGKKLTRNMIMPIMEMLHFQPTVWLNVLEYSQDYSNQYAGGLGNHVSNLGFFVFMNSHKIDPVGDGDMYPHFLSVATPEGYVLFLQTVCMIFDEQSGVDGKIIYFPIEPLVLNARINGRNAPILAALLFQSQKFVEQAPITGLPRPMRRRLEKAGKEKHLQDARIIQLRRRTVIRPKTGEEEEKGVDWQCQWLVKGHWRNQYMPSTKSHEPRYIMPYKKGPDDKPLRQPRQSVYMVSR